MSPDQYERAALKLKAMTADLFRGLYPHPFMVTDVAIVARVTCEDGRNTAMTITTMANDPWGLLGLYHAEILRVENFLSDLQGQIVGGLATDDGISPGGTDE